MNIKNRDIRNGDSFGTGLGYLIVRVTTARGAVPVPDATVNIRASGNSSSEILYSVTTDTNGMTEKISLPAPSAADLATTLYFRPYYPYIVEVYAEGYYPQTYHDVTVYDGITSYQTAELVPLSEEMSHQSLHFGMPVIVRCDEMPTTRQNNGVTHTPDSGNSVSNDMTTSQDQLSDNSGNPFQREM